ncbi:MAG: GNAT family N-acetyltransferase [Anaeromassilibacillus sp.]
MEFELRPWRMEDAETIARYANNPKVAANLRDAFPTPIPSGMRRRLSKAAWTRTPPVLLPRDRGEWGDGWQHQPFHRRGYFLKSAEPATAGGAVLGAGIMPEAVRQICGFAFQTYGLARIFAVPFAYNLASAASWKGRIPTGRSYAEQVHKRGMLYNSYLYARTSQDGPAHDPDRTDREEHASAG